MEDELPTMQLVPVAFEDKAVLHRLLELYCYDFSEFTGDDLNAHGEYDYERLDHYWTDEDRYPFFIQVNNRLAGFVLVHDLAGPPGDAPVHAIAEFFIMRKYRRQGIGQAVAFQVFDRFPGRWSVTQIEENRPAHLFWRKVIGAYTGGNYTEARHADGPGQVFTAKAGQRGK